MRKRSLTCLVALAMLLAAPALGEERPFVLMLGTDVLARADGALITQPDEYLFITPLPDGSFAGTLPEGGARLLDATGAAAGEVYEDIFAQGDIICVTQGGLTGVLGADHALKVPCEHTQVIASGNGTYLAINSDPYDEKPDGVYFVDGTGAERATGIRVWYGLSEFSEGLMPAVDATTGRMGYLDGTGEWAIGAQYEYAGAFQGGAAVAAIAAGTGLIDREGNWLLTPKYQAVGRFGAGGKLVLAQEDPTRITLLDGESYEEIAAYDGTDICFFADMACGAATLYLDDCTRLIGEKGQTLVECSLDVSFDMWSETRDRVLLRMGEWGEESVWLYDLAGKAVAGPWQDAWLLGEDGGRAYYAVGDLSAGDEEGAAAEALAIIDQDGREIAPRMALNACAMDEAGRLILEGEDGAGAMRADGTLICWYDRAGNAAQVPFVK